jgi:polyhydroxybutyrate depolymerase
VIAAAVTAVVLGGCSQDPIKVTVPPSSGAASAGASTPVPPPATPGKVTNSKSQILVSGGTQRAYRMHFPLVTGTGPRPLVIALHPGGSSPQTMEFTIGLDSAADRQGIYVVYPEAIGGYWNNGRPASLKHLEGGVTGPVSDAQFILDVIESAKKKQAIDAKRIFIVGQGDGGIMALQAAAAAPGVFRGVAVVSGQLLVRQPLPKTPLPILLIHGNADPVFPWAGIAAVKDGGPVASMDATIKACLGLDGLGSAKPQVVAMPNRDSQDGTTVTRSIWGPSAAGMTVTLYTVVGGGYPWPGGAVSTRNQATHGRTSRDLDAASIVTHFALEAGNSTPSSPPSATP